MTEINMEVEPQGACPCLVVRAYRIGVDAARNAATAAEDLLKHVSGEALLDEENLRAVKDLLNYVEYDIGKADGLFEAFAGPGAADDDLIM